jgi:hypothetical protein
LIEDSGASLVGVSVIVDQLDADVRSSLSKFHALIQRDQLGPDT